jgi:hypothetical protein
VSAQVIWVPGIAFSHLAWMKLQGFLCLSELEISGFGKVIQTSPADFLVEDVFVLPQQVSGAETVMDSTTIALVVDQMIQAGENPADIRLWWHSHARGGLYWSSTDDKTMQILTQDSSYWFGLLGNMRGQVKVRLDQSLPIALSIDDIPVVLQAEPEILAWCQSEIDRNVSLLPPPKRHGKWTNQLGGGMVELFGIANEEEDDD